MSESRVIGIRVDSSTYEKYNKLNESVKQIVIVIVKKVLEDVVNNIEQLLTQHNVNVSVTLSLVQKQDSNNVIAKLEAYKNKIERTVEILTQYRKGFIDSADVIQELLELYKYKLEEV